MPMDTEFRIDFYLLGTNGTNQELNKTKEKFALIKEVTHLLAWQNKI